MSNRSIKKIKLNKKPTWLKTVRRLFFLLIILLLLGLVYQQIYAQKIYPGTKIGAIKVGGLTKIEAENLLNKRIKQFYETSLIFFTHDTRIKGKEISIDPNLIAITDPDLSRPILIFDVPQTVNELLTIGRKKNIIKNFYEIFSNFLVRRSIRFFFQLDEQEMVKILQDNFSKLEDPMQNTQLMFNEEEKQFSLTEAKGGLAFDYQQSIGQLKENLFFLINQPIELKLIIKQPEIVSLDCVDNLSQAQKLIVKDSWKVIYNEQNWLIKNEDLISWVEVRPEIGLDGRCLLGLNQQETEKFLKEKISPEVNVLVQDAKFKMENERVVEFQTSKEGERVSLENNWRLLEKNIIQENKQEINLLVEKIKPKIAVAQINDLGIKELIGRGESNFSGSPSNRRHNIAVGSKQLNGLLIGPEEEFSLVQAIGDVNKETGYLAELVIKGNRTIPEFGGGLCQIGTTAFRVALNTGLPVTARTPHSYRVSYYEPAGMDATIYRPQPDLRFINDTGHYILWQTNIDGNNLIFEFYGNNDGRQIEVSQPKLYNFVKPPEIKYVETEELEPGEKKRIESTHTGCDAVFTRKII
ncbi:MAG: VanW family protein, partial [Candidatus Aenigmarchaeota archaeon]|nr:VanW family protein [Candidatus Aenigmarchaeota archaeon]